MKFNYFGLNLEYPIRDCYSKCGFGNNEPYTSDFQYEIALFIREETQKQNLPYSVRINQHSSKYTILFLDEKGNTYSLENEPEEIKKFLDKLDKKVF